MRAAVRQPSAGLGVWSRGPAKAAALAAGPARGPPTCRRWTIPPLTPSSPAHALYGPSGR
jgi:hypothetical protein